MLVREGALDVSWMRFVRERALPWRIVCVPWRIVTPAPSANFSSSEEKLCSAFCPVAEGMSFPERVGGRLGRISSFPQE